MGSVIFVVGLIGSIFAAWAAWQLMVGAILLLMFVFWLLKKIVGAITAEPEYEIVGLPLTEKFKQSARGNLAGDMWTDGHRVYFEVDGRSYSVADDLDGARSRKNAILAMVRAFKPNAK